MFRFDGPYCHVGADVPGERFEVVTALFECRFDDDRPDVLQVKSYRKSDPHDGVPAVRWGAVAFTPRDGQCVPFRIG